jgi:hypothetical protein
MAILPDATVFTLWLLYCWVGWGVKPTILCVRLDGMPTLQRRLRVRVSVPMKCGIKCKNKCGAPT